MMGYDNVMIQIVEIFQSSNILYFEFFAGFIGWFATGIDDIIIFSTIIITIASNLEKSFAVMGFFLGVIVMTILCFVGGVAYNILPKWTYYIITLIPIFLGIKTLIQSFDINEELKNMNIGKHTIFMSAFLGYFLNSSDDIAYNLSWFAKLSSVQELVYISGIWMGAITMVVIVLFFNIFTLKDYPKIRGFILIGVGVWLFMNGGGVTAHNLG